VASSHDDRGKMPLPHVADELRSKSSNLAHIVLPHAQLMAEGLPGELPVARNHDHAAGHVFEESYPHVKGAVFRADRNPVPVGDTEVGRIPAVKSGKRLCRKRFEAGGAG
jgi:hypothetical protein